jgi:hypothetical protein
MWNWAGKVKGAKLQSLLKAPLVQQKQQKDDAELRKARK